VSTATTYRHLHIPRVLVVLVITALVAIAIALAVVESQGVAAAQPASPAGTLPPPTMSGDFADRPLA
jgi:hypothetical protein